MPYRKPRKRVELAQTETIDRLPLACADETAAVEFLEAGRWGDTPCCVHCGSIAVYKMTDRATGQRNKRFLWRCRDCSKQYTVRVGTVFEDSPLPLRMWIRAFWEASSAKNGISALELSRKLQITYKSALFVMHRVRLAMKEDHSPKPKMTGTVEMDETYVGGRPRRKNYADYAPRRKGQRGPYDGKVPVTAIVQRGGNVRAQVMPIVTSHNIEAMLKQNVERGSIICTDDSTPYKRVARAHGLHKTVRHGLREYVNLDDPTNHTNTIEGFFSRIKRQLNGTYHAVSRQHLHRYVAHAEFLYNARYMNDGERIMHLIRCANGKRLVYRQTA